MPEEYSSDTIERIWADVQQAQGKRRARVLTRDDIGKALQIVAVHLYGEITIDACCSGRKAPRKGEKTELHISWYSWRRKKWVVWWIERVPVEPEDNQQTAIITKYYGKRSAWISTFPERYQKYRNTGIIHRLMRRGYILPPNIQDIYVDDERCGMTLITCQMNEIYGRYLCSPLGYTEVQEQDRVYDAAKSVGIVLPKDAKNYTWEDVEPLWIMARLKNTSAFSCKVDSK